MYVSKANEAIVLDPSPLLDQIFPVAPRLPDGRVVLPHNLDTFKALQSYGTTIPHPLFIYYDWAGGTPFDTQKLTTRMLVNNRRGYVLNDMGTGKTRAALWAWDYLNKNKLAQKLLVVCPLQTTHQTWASEIFQILPTRKVVVLHASSRARRIERLAQDADIYIINHDGVKVIANELMQRQDIDTMVLDELDTYRNINDRTKLMAKFAAPMKWVWGMTGTPMPNAPTDVYGQCKVLTPYSVPRFPSHFKQQLMKQVSKWEWIPRPNAIKQAYDCMQPSVRFTLDEVVELPPVIERFIDVPLTPEQESIYKQLKAMYHVWVKENKLTAANAAAAMSKLLQISAGWVYCDGVPTQIDAGNRVEMLLNLIGQCQRKVIVFASFRHIVNGLSQILTEKNIGHVKIYGGVDGREDLFNTWKHDPSVKVLLAQPKCMSHGLNLTQADTIIWYCPITSNGTYQQADARIRRVGQKHKQQILHLAGTPVERGVYRALKNKQANQVTFLKMFVENGNGNGAEAA